MRTNAKTARLTQLALFAAIEVLLAFTPLGFIQLPLISITTCHIPVIIAAILLGPVDGGIIGGVMGICSMIRSLTSASALSIVINPFISANPIASVIMDILPRVLIGVFAGLFYRAMAKTKCPTVISCALAGVVGSLTNTVFFLGIMALVFSDVTGMTLMAILETIAATNGILEICAAALVSAAVCVPVMKALRMKVIERKAPVDETLQEG